MARLQSRRRHQLRVDVHRVLGQQRPLALNPTRRKTGWLVWAGLALLLATLLMAFLPAQLRLRQALGKPLPVIGQIAEFNLTNQNSQAVPQAALRGHVWVADIIFTRCPGPCLKMSRQMKELQQGLSPSSHTKLVTLTTDPDFDTPAVLKTYSERFNADPNRWLFLTGPKTEIAKLAADSLKLTALEKKPEERESPNDLFIHSTIFVLVDKQARLRGVFETTGEGVDPQRVKGEILAGIHRLEREP